MDGRYEFTKSGLAGRSRDWGATVNQSINRPNTASRFVLTINQLISQSINQSNNGMCNWDFTFSSLLLSTFSNQHMQGIDLVNRICNGKLSGCSIRSQEVNLTPGGLSGGEYIGDSITAGYDIYLSSSLSLVFATCLISPAEVSDFSLKLLYRVRCLPMDQPRCACGEEQMLM